MASVTLNGVTYTDDANPATGMANGGHRVRFIPSLSNFLAEAANQIAAAQQKVVAAQQQVTLAAAHVSSAQAQALIAAQQAALATSNGAAQVALAAAQATAAASSASAAASASASAGYAGVWVALSGPLNPPASVAHAGKLWALIAPLADVATAEPGLSSLWYPLGGVAEADTLFINFFLS